MKNLDGLRADKLLDNLHSYFLHYTDNFTLQNEWFYLIGGLLALYFVLKSIRSYLSIKYSLNEQSILLELIPPSFTEQESYTTDQLFSIIHAIGNQKNILERLMGYNSRFSLEIVSTKTQGIRYLIRTSPKHVNTFKRSLLSYLHHMK